MPRLHQGLGNRDQGGLSVLKRRIEVRWTRQVQNDNVMYISVMPYRHGHSCFSRQVIYSPYNCYT
jgi:hypothetical protein